MADPVVSTLASGSSATATTTPTFTAQAAGTLLLLQVQSDDYKTGDPAGWTLAASGQDFLGHYLWYKIAAGSETSVAYTIGSAVASAYQVIAATNIDPTPLGVTSSLHTHGGSTTGTTAVTPTSGSRWLVVGSLAGMHSSASSLGPAAAVSNGYTIRSSVTGTGSPTEVGMFTYLTLDGGTATSTATVSPGWTVNAPQCSYGLLAAFKVASGSGPVTASPSGIASALALGAVTVALTLGVALTGIPTAETFGTPTATATLTAAPTGIGSGSAFGSPTVTIPITASPSGIATGETFGTPAVAAAITASPSSVATAEAFGTVSVVTAGSVSPTGIASAETFGAPVVSTTLTAAPTGIGSAAAVGSPAIAATLTSSPAGIGTAEAVGAPVISLTVTASPSSIATGETFGTPTIPGAYAPLVAADHIRTVPARPAARTVPARVTARTVPARPHVRSVP